MNRLKFFRLLNEKSQDEITHSTGINQTRVSRIERSIVSPNEKEKQSISKTLNVDPKAIFPKE